MRVVGPPLHSAPPDVLYAGCNGIVVIFSAACPTRATPCAFGEKREMGHVGNRTLAVSSHPSSILSGAAPALFGRVVHVLRLPRGAPAANRDVSLGAHVNNIRGTEGLRGFLRPGASGTTSTRRVRSSAVPLRRALNCLIWTLLIGGCLDRGAITLNLRQPRLPSPRPTCPASSTSRAIK
jgi:hypothetical protein